MSWRLLIHPDLPGYTQMAIDEALFLLASAERPPVLRFYTWRHPTLSLGYFQNYKGIVSEPYIVHNKIDVVRRITGGRTVLHNEEVTYSVASALQGCFKNQSLRETYGLISQALNCGLEMMGIQKSKFSADLLKSQAQQESKLAQCFVAVSPFEISIGDTRKIIGSAQKRSQNRFLQHGSILLDFDPALQNGCILRPDPEIERKVSPINQLLGRSVSFDEVASHFQKAFEENFQVSLESSALDDQERELAGSLEAKYMSREWTQHGCR
jgi:lipoyl(octanoyl) transferase